MLVPVEEEAPASALDWHRYKIPAMVAAGVLVGVVAGAMLFSGGDHDAPEQAAQAPLRRAPLKPHRTRRK